MAEWKQTEAPMPVYGHCCNPGCDYVGELTSSGTCGPDCREEVYREIFSAEILAEADALVGPEFPGD